MNISQISPPCFFRDYLIYEKLGAGAMAAVFLADKLRGNSFSSYSALKMIHPDYARDPRYEQFFIREAQVGGLLDHPNIVKTIDFGKDGDVLYLAMQYVEGLSLGDALAKLKGEAERPAYMPRVPFPVTFAIMRDLLKGLDYAHTAKDRQDRSLRLVHRDLKPSNLMLSRHGTVLLADFGIARASRELEDVFQTHFAVDARRRSPGTPLYMAPEAALGHDEPDHRADLFAAGIIFYELVSDRRLYEGRTHDEISQYAIERKYEPKLSALPEGPYQQSLTSFLHRALAYSASERFQSAAAMWDALEDLRCSLGLQIAPDLKDWLKESGLMDEIDAHRDSLTRHIQAAQHMRKEWLDNPPASKEQTPAPPPPVPNPVPPLDIKVDAPPKHADGALWKGPRLYLGVSLAVSLVITLVLWGLTSDVLSQPDAQPGTKPRPQPSTPLPQTPEVTPIVVRERTPRPPKSTPQPPKPPDTPRPASTGLNVTISGLAGTGLSSSQVQQEWRSALATYPGLESKLVHLGASSRSVVRFKKSAIGDSPYCEVEVDVRLSRPGNEGQLESFNGSRRCEPGEESQVYEELSSIGMEKAARWLSGQL